MESVNKILLVIIGLFFINLMSTAETQPMDNTKTTPKTLRLMMPQWQGGDYHEVFPNQIYPMGARLLAFLAPASDSPIIEVPVEPYKGATPPKENGVLWQQQVLKQFKAARQIIDKEQPDRIITFGGDCLVSQAPFAYLNEKYQGKVGVLWIDAHPDITTPANFDRAHAMVLGNLLGGGDPLMTQEVKRPFKAEQVLLVSVNEVLPHEQKTIDQLGLRKIPTKDIATNSEVILQWLKANQFSHLLIHVDLDVLDPNSFNSLLLNNPYADKPFATAKGQLTIGQLTRIIKDASQQTEVVGISFTEHMPWDAYHLKNMMEQFTFMK